MTNDSTGEKIKEKVMETKDKVKETVGMGEKGTQGIKDKVRKQLVWEQEKEEAANGRRDN